MRAFVRTLRYSRGWSARLVAAVFAAAVFATPAYAQQPTQATPTQVRPAQATPATAPVPTPIDRAPVGPAPAAVSDDYVIGPGDSIQVFVWLNPELSTNVAVRPDGKISTPLVEDMVAAGKTPSNLARDVERVLAEYIRQPKVNVIVTQAVSTFRQVKVVGQVRQPQSIAYRDGLRVLDAILAVGGVSEFAAANRARIVRGEGENAKEIRVRLGDLVEKGELEHNHALQPGDVIVVPQSWF